VPPISAAVTRAELVLAAFSTLSGSQLLSVLNSSPPLIDAPPSATIAAGTALDALLICDADGKVQQWNLAAQALLGLSAEAMAASPVVAEVLRKHAAQLRPVTWPDGEGHAHIQLLLPPAEGGSPTSLEMQFSRILRSDGAYGLGVVLRAGGQARDGSVEALNARLKRIIGQSPAGIVETDASGRMTFVNRAWCEMLGYSEAELRDMTVFDITHPDSLQATKEALAALMAGTEGVTLEKSYHRRDGSVLFASSSVTALRDAGGGFTGISAIVLDISDRLAAEARLRESAKRLRQILDNTVAMIGILRPDGTLIEANTAALTAAGLTREDVIGRKFWDCYWWSHDPEAMLRLQQAIARTATGEVERYDEVVRMKDDSRITIDFMLSPVMGEDGRVELLVPSGVDISERKRSEEQFANLMREVNHRSKNLLTVVQSILRQMKPRDVKGFVSDFGQRLAALSICQDLLINSATESVALDQLIVSQLGHFRDALGERIQLGGPNLIVAPEVAQSIGMAIYELCTNAGKYGALSNERGRIDITWQVDFDSEAGCEMFSLNWVETDGPEVSEPDEAGFGSVVLGDMLAMTLDCAVSTNYFREGLQWHLRCPVHKLVGVEAAKERSRHT
jgi:PAS domain S-box-containing protein